MKFYYGNKEKMGKPFKAKVCIANALCVYKYRCLTSALQQIIYLF